MFAGRSDWFMQFCNHAHERAHSNESGLFDGQQHCTTQLSRGVPVFIASRRWEETVLFGRRAATTVDSQTTVELDSRYSFSINRSVISKSLI